MGGAAHLSSLACLRTGAGIVRLFYMPGMDTASLPVEIIREECDLARIEEESKRARSFFVGPGLGRTKEVEKFLKKLLNLLNHPTVFDADALYFFAQNPRITIPLPSILTPHREEMRRLLQDSDPTLQHCQNFAQEKGVTLVLKGAPTFIFQNAEKPVVVTAGDPAMATAGSGDVLTGILAALLAKKLSPIEAACLGCYLHGKAGEAAAAQQTSRGVIASDLIDHLPDALRTFAS